MRELLALCAMSLTDPTLCEPEARCCAANVFDLLRTVNAQVCSVQFEAHMKHSDEFQPESRTQSAAPSLLGYSACLNPHRLDWVGRVPPTASTLLVDAAP